MKLKCQEFLPISKTDETQPVKKSKFVFSGNAAITQTQSNQGTGPTPATTNTGPTFSFGVPSF